MTFFDEVYEGVPPWDIGRPQEAIVELHKRGLIADGPLLDAGCGTGEHALYFAANGFHVMGIDFTPRAIEKAKAKARARKLKVDFRVHDALDLAALNRTFATVIDSGLFHVFGDRERRRFADGLAEVLRPGGTYHMLCFSEKEPEDWGGPRRVTKPEILASFPPPRFRVRSIEETRFESNFHDGGGYAYLATVDRSGEKS